MRNLFIALCLAVLSFGILADTKEIRRGSWVDLYIMQDGPYANYRIITVPPNDHKIVYQPSAANKNTERAYCNQVAEDDDPYCDTYDPDPVYAAWDAASQTTGQTLTAANRRQWLYVWHFENYILKRMRSVKTWLKTQSGWTTTRQNYAFRGNLIGWGMDPVDAGTCATKMIDNDLTCNWEDTGRLHMDNIEKAMIDELHDAVIELP